MKTSKNILVLYHGNCTDGFGAAWVAWKKFGDTAEYLPQERTSVPSKDLFIDKEVYIVDYSFSKDEMLSFESVAKKFVCIDHHISAKDAVTSLKEYVFDISNSGVYLTWKYFYPNDEMPMFIKYISDADTWAHVMPDWELIEAYLYRDSVERFSFSFFNKLNDSISTEEGYIKAKEIGEMLLDSHKAKVNMYVRDAELVSFEGYEVYAVNGPREVVSELGHELAVKTNSFGIVFQYKEGVWKCSLRSVQDFDVSVLAEKYGGGGHKNAAAFIVPTDFPLPFVKK